MKFYELKGVEYSIKKRVSILFSCILVLMVLSECNKQIFDGSRTSNEKQFILPYSHLSKILSHEMILEEGNKINVNVKSKSGTVDILITDSRNNEIYKAQDALTSNFIIDITESSTYKFVVTGTKAKGGVSFIIKE